MVGETPQCDFKLMGPTTSYNEQSCRARSFSFGLENLGDVMMPKKANAPQMAREVLPESLWNFKFWDYAWDEELCNMCSIVEH